ncbi:MAG: rRNA maturation RNase YbeY [Bacilli bacterium]|mgnify:FL=1|jgi:probable rRNA maturation factor|nr:rRNA maturation RNase YbeY [Bacilli bacterium]HOH59131.1 rRNA maturation RNase YbeY [Bacilli bacterium]
MKINLFLEVKEEFEFEDLIKKIAKLFKDKMSLSLIIVNDKQMRDINFQYRDLDKTTDVLSFPDTEEDYLGDIFISLDKVKLQAVEYEHSEMEEFARLLIHGILHLMGYDHIKDEDHEVMVKKEEELLKKLFG